MTQSAAMPDLGESSAAVVVLFGMPDAGKSSLLGALVQASQIQERTLGGRLRDIPENLAELRRRVYEEKPRETLQEIVPFPVHFLPLTAPGGQSQPASLTLVDCDGRVANDLLARTNGLGDESSMGLLGQAIQQAQALVLVVDASASASQVDDDLAELVRFLRLFRAQRGRRTEVGGLPVALVLSKCDRLARPDDDARAWTDRIEREKSRFEQRFRDFLEQSSDTAAQTPFGEIDLTIAATAVKHPSLRGSPDRTRDPWGVAELFRQTFAAAQAFRIRQEQAGHRLFWTLTGMTAVIALLFAMGWAATQFRGSRTPVALVGKVESYRAREGQTASVRLAEPLQRKFGELTDFSNDADFSRLPSDLQQFVRGRLNEITAYRDFRDRLHQLRSPAECRSLEELAKLERHLVEDTPVPAAFQKNWQQSEAVLLRSKWLDDISVLKDAASQLEDGYRQWIQRGNQLLLFRGATAETAPAWADWMAQANRLLQESQRSLGQGRDRLRNARELPGSPAVTLATVLEYPTVLQARGDWERIRGRLDKVRDLATALGLAPVESPPAVLRLPVDFAVEQAKSTWQNLRTYYPKSREWSIADLPEALAMRLRFELKTPYQRTIQAGRAALLDRYRQHGAGDNRETQARWQAAAEGLAASPEAAEWREFTNWLTRLIDPEAREPLAALIAFVRADRLTASPQNWSLRIPNTPQEERVRPIGKLIIAVQDAEKSTKRYPFKFDSEANDAAHQAKLYTFIPENAATIVMRPGDVVWAELDGRDFRGHECRLSWWANGGRSLLYQFDALRLPPRLHGLEQKIETGSLCEHIVLTPDPANSWPDFPELFPTQR